MGVWSLGSFRQLSAARAAMLAVETTLAKNATKTSNGTVLIRFDIFSSHVARRPIYFSARIWVAMGRNFVQRAALFRLAFAGLAPPLEEIALQLSKRGEVGVVARNKAEVGQEPQYLRRANHVGSASERRPQRDLVGLSRWAISGMMRRTN